MSHGIAGARGTVGDPEAVLRRVQAWARARAVEVSLADGRAVFGADHLESAALHAERAQRSGAMATRSLGMETILYLSGQRQVADALRVAGLRAGTEQVAVAVFGPAAAEELLAELGWVRDDAVLEATGKSLRVLGVTAAEEATAPPARAADLALERTALLDVKK